MNHQLSEIFDIVMLMLVLVIALEIGVVPLYQTNREVQKNTITYMDKNTTVKYTPSEKIYGTYDGSMGAEELILMTQIQDYNMPYPNTIICDDVKITIQPGSRELLGEYAASLWSRIKVHGIGKTYYVNYDYKEDAYVISEK